MIVEAVLPAVLHCAVTPAPPLAATSSPSIEFNLVLEEALARSMRMAEPPAMALRFADEAGTPGRGWIVHNSYSTDEPELVLGRVTLAGAERALFIRWGQASRGLAGEPLAWRETMRGPCRLAGEEVLK